MNTSLKNKLLLGSAVIAIGAFTAGTASAQQLSIDNNNDGTFNQNIADDGNLDTGTESKDAQVNGGATTKINVNGATFTIGQLGDGKLAGGGNRPSITQDISGRTLQFKAAGAGARALTIAGSATENSVGITGDQTAMNLTFLANTAENFAFNVNINGGVNLGTGTLTIDANAGNGADADVTVNAAGNITAATIAMTSNAAKVATLNLNGTTAQNIDAAVTGTGTIIVDNAAGATFTKAVTASQITVEKASDGNSSVTFKAAVTAPITLGGAGTGKNTVNFDTTGGDYTVNGVVKGAIAAENNVINVTGGKVLTAASQWGSGDNNLDTINVTGTGTTLVQGAAALQAVQTNVGAGAILRTTGNTITSAIANAGTIQMNGGNITGNITGAGTISVGGNGTITGDVTQSGINFATNDTLTIAAGNRTITSNVTTGTNGEGKISVADGAGTTAFVGNIGESVRTLAKFAVLGGAAQTVTLTGNLFANAIEVNDADTLQFIGTSAQTVSGTVNNGILHVGNGTTASNVTFNGVQTAIASAKTFVKSSTTYNANATIAGNLQNDGTITVAQGKTLTAAGFTAGAAVGNYNIVIGTTAAGVDQSATLASGNAIDYNLLNGTTANGARLTMTQGTGVIINNQAFRIADGTGAVTNLTATPVAVNDTFALFNFTVRTGDNAVLAGSDNSDILAIAAVDRTAGGVVKSGANQSTADAVLGVTAAQYEASNNIAGFVGNTRFREVYDAVTRGNTGNINDLLDSVRPDVDASGVVAARTVVTQSTNLANTQLAALRDGTETGMYAGNVANGLRAWGQVFGQTADQNRRDGIAGFDADTYGFALGLDTAAIADNWVWGLMFAYSDTEVKSKGANRTRTDIDSYQVGVYANYDIDDRTYVTGQVGYVWMDNDQRRFNLGGIQGLNASSSFDSNSIYARLEAGRDYAAAQNTTVTPKLLLNYQHYDADGYTERDAGTAGLRVSGDKLNIFEIGVATDVKWDLQQADGSILQPKLGVGVRHDLVGDEYQTTNNVIGVPGPGTSFRTKGFDPAQTTFNIGAGLTYFSTTNWELSAAYDYEVKSDFDAHSGSLRAAYRF
jgi:outer membrane autotransporter protein